MSFLIGKNEQVSNVNQQTGDLQKMLMDYLGSGQGLDRLFPGVQPDKASMQPYLDMFTMQNQRNFAQAKESVGNLTGSSLGNILGSEMGRASTDQNAMLANLFEQRRTADANRFAATLLGGLNSNAGGVTNMYQPGLLDYASQAAAGLASGGAFNSLFSKTKKGPGE